MNKDRKTDIIMGTFNTKVIKDDERSVHLIYNPREESHVVILRSKYFILESRIYNSEFDDSTTRNIIDRLEATYKFYSKLGKQKGFLNLFCKLLDADSEEPNELFIVGGLHHEQ